MRRTGNRTVGSNPTLSATSSDLCYGQGPRLITYYTGRIERECSWGGRAVQQFCLISYRHGRPIAAERMTAVDDGDAVSQVLARQGAASFEIYQRQRLVAVLENG